MAYGNLKSPIERPATPAAAFDLVRVQQVLLSLDPESNLFQVEASGTVGRLVDDEFEPAEGEEAVRVTFLAKPTSAVTDNAEDLFTDIAAQLVKAQAKAGKSKAGK